MKKRAPTTSRCPLIYHLPILESKTETALILSVCLLSPRQPAALSACCKLGDFRLRDAAPQWGFPVVDVCPPPAGTQAAPRGGQVVFGAARRTTCGRAPTHCGHAGDSRRGPSRFWGGPANDLSGVMRHGSKMRFLLPPQSQYVSLAQKAFGYGHTDHSV